VFPDLDELRHALGLIVLVTVPVNLGVWLLIHPLARTWRRVGPVGSYAALTVPSLAVAAWLWSSRRTLLGADLGLHPVLVAIAVGAFAAAIAIARVRRRQLTSRILAGVPELSRDKGRLLTEGIYARTRNPRYLEFLLFALGFVAIANHAGTWLLWALCFPGVHLVVLLEERELRDRFGAEYDAYCRRVARYLPPLGS
jgi:protein-S-isoprenylcysteine O-methyltransferase Ste14